MSRHMFGSPGDHALLAGGGLAFGLGLVVSATVPGAETVLDGCAVALVAVLVLAAAGWTVFQMAGELRLSRELSRPAVPPHDGWRTCLRPVQAPEPLEAAESVGGEQR